MPKKTPKLHYCPECKGAPVPGGWRYMDEGEACVNECHGKRRAAPFKKKMTKKKRKKLTEKNRKLAERIIKSLGKNTAPGSCTWGDQHQEAHADLFGCERHDPNDSYVEDMVLDVVRVLSRSRLK